MNERSAELALRRYCPTSLVAEYERLRPLEKGKLLTALVSTQQNHLLNFEQNRYMNNSYSTRPERNKAANSDCPLVQTLLSMNVSRRVIDEDSMAYCRQTMRTWGDDGQYSASQRIIKYNATVANQKQGQGYNNTNAPAGVKHLMNTNGSVTKKGGLPRWKNLKRIDISDLKLFATSAGCYVEGTIVGEAIQPMVGGTSLVQDAQGKVLMICFYNMLPDGIRGAEAEPLLRAKFPMGATVRVAEPFLKIFGDGSRGIRSDNPADFQIVAKLSGKESPSSCSTEEKLMEAKKEGNTFVSQKRYDSALDVYVSALRSTSNDFVPTLLSNRAQAFICMGHWGSGLCDAAASLTIRPKSQKTWDRYHLCGTKLASQAGVDCERAVNGAQQRLPFSLLLDSILPPGLTRDTFPLTRDEAEDNISAAESKDLGNKAFRCNDFDTAVNYYSRALLKAGCTVRALLSNWALCALEIGATMDAIAAAAASLRLAPDVKATYRLSKALALIGEYALSIRVSRLRCEETSPSDNKILLALGDDANKMQNLIDEGALSDCTCLFSVNASLLANWIGPVETFLTNSKGRGIRAIRDCRRGEVLLIQRAMLCAQVDANDDVLLIAHTSDRKFDTKAAVKLKAALVHRSQRDGVLSQIVNRLSDGGKSANALVPFSDLMLNLDCCPLLLPGHHCYFKEGGLQLTAERIGKILRTNIHGGELEHEMIDGAKLYPAISMINHSSNANASFVPLKGTSPVAVVAARRPIKKGEELSMMYLEDDAAVERHWGKLHD